METMSPISWALRPFKKYATFSGRAPRAEMWWFMLFELVFYFGVILLLGLTAGGVAAANPASALATGSFGIGMLFVMLFWLALFVPTLAVQVRRLHDTDRSGWWLGGFWLLYLVYMGTAIAGTRFAAASPDAVMAGAAGMGIVALAFFAYSIVLLVFWCKRGTAGPNRFGDDPYGANVEQVFA